MPTWLGVVIGIAVGAVAGLGYVRARARGEPPAPSDAPSPTAADESERIDAFWAWWPGEAARLAAAFDARQGESRVELLGARVHALHPELAWETGPGLKGGRHHLALSSEGDPALRVLVERWFARAPAPDGVWEFYPARQATPGHRKVSLTLRGPEDVALDFASARVSYETVEARERVDVTFHHAALARLSEDRRFGAALLMLENVLGEDCVERWIGSVECSVDPLADAKPLEALRDAVGALAEVATGERFALLRGRNAEGAPLLAVANLALKRLDHLLMDHHLEIVTEFLEQGENGLPTPAEDDALRELEDELVEALGHDAVYIGHETGEGRRTIHLHVAGQGPAMARTDAWARSHPERELAIELRYDPGWEVLRRW